MISSSIFARVLCIAAIACAFLAPQPALAQPHSPPGAPPTTDTREKVWQALLADLRADGLTEANLPRLEDLDLPAALPALATSQLRVTSACWDKLPQRTQFRLECGEPGQCLPFLVYLRGASEKDSPPGVPPCRPVSAPPSTPQLRSAAEVSPAPTIRQGETATAVFVTSNFRMTASVTCLERGRLGEIIRVRSQNGQVFRARISGPGQLEALPQ